MSISPMQATTNYPQKSEMAISHTTTDKNGHNAGQAVSGAAEKSSFEEETITEQPKAPKQRKKAAAKSTCSGVEESKA